MVFALSYHLPPTIVNHKPRTPSLYFQHIEKGHKSGAGDKTPKLTEVHNALDTHRQPIGCGFTRDKTRHIAFTLQTSR